MIQISQVDITSTQVAKKAMIDAMPLPFKVQGVDALIGYFPAPFIIVHPNAIVFGLTIEVYKDTHWSRDKLELISSETLAGMSLPELVEPAGRVLRDMFTQANLGDGRFVVSKNEAEAHIVVALEWFFGVNIAFDGYTQAYKLVERHT